MVLALVPVLVVAGRLVAPSWVPVPDADHDALLLAFTLTTLFLACATPWLLLPVGPASGVRVDDDGRLTVPTVLGTRRLDLADLRRVDALTVWGRGGNDHYLSLRAGRRWVVLALGGAPQVPSAVRRRVGDAARERPEVLSERAHAILGIAPVPSRSRRVVLGVIAFVVGSLAYWAWVLVVTAAILATYVPFP